MKKELFNIENQYKLFLEKMELREELMSSIQRQQLKHTFFGAFVQSLLLFRDELPNDMEQGAQLLHNMIQEAIAFFEKEVEKRNTIN